MLDWNYLSFSAFLNLLSGCSVSYIIIKSLIIRKKINKTKIIWLLFTLSISFWSLGFFLAFSTVKNIEIFIFWIRFLNLSAIFVPIFFLHFVYLFLNIEEKKKNIIIFGYVVTILYLLISIIFKNHFISSAEPKMSFLYYPSAGYIYYFFPILFSIFLGVGFYNLYQYRKKSSIKQKPRINYILIATIIGLFGGGTTFPLVFDIPVYPFGTIAVSFMMMIITYAVIKYKIVDITLATSIIFSKLLTYIFFSIVFVIFYFSFSGNYLPHNNFYLLLGVTFLIIICELYSFIRSKIEDLSSNILLKKEKKYKYLESLVGNNFISSVRLDNLLPFIVEIITKDFNLILDKLCVKGELFIEDEQKNINDYFLYKKSIIDLNNAISNKEIKKIFEPVELFDGNNNKIRIPFCSDNNLLGFIDVKSKIKDDITYRKIDILDKLSKRISISLDRILIYHKMLIQQKQFLIEKQKMLQSLGGSIAHEMRNPLGSIQQSTYILIEKLSKISNSYKAKELIEVKEIIEMINHSSARGNMIIDMILANIHEKEIDKSKFKLSKIRDIVNIAIKEFSFEEGERSKVLIDIDNEQDFYFKGDKNMMIFVIFNLLKNALYYLKTHPNSQITIYTNGVTINKESKNYNYLYFKDTGSGIAKNKLESIFKSFMTSDKKGGTGLGLPFCKRVMKAFGGDIICKSELEKYTIFIMNFPKIENNKKNIVENEIKEIIKDKYGKKNILIIDDNLVNRMVISRRLSNLDFTVIVAEHGHEALNILNKRNDIDFIITDLNMPNIDGYKILELIKSKNKNYKNTPIIAYTGDNDDDTIKKIRESGFSGFMSKGWEDDDLFNILNKIYT